MRAVIIGAVESSRIAAECLHKAPSWDVAGIVSLPPELASRHSDFVDLAPTAERAGCPLICVENANSDDAISRIAALAPDYLFVIGWSQLCGERLMEMTPGQVIGFHPAPLPRLRGRGVIPWTILLDEPITASTIFMIDGGTDSGPILAQRFFHVAPDETAATLYAKHMTALTEILPGLLADLVEGTAAPAPQDPRLATWAARRRPEDGEIDWSGSAEAAWRQVRACGDPYPGARATYRDEPIVIKRARIVSLAGHRAGLVGQIVERGSEGFTVRCGDGRGLLVHDWQWSRPGPPPLHSKLAVRAGGCGCR